MVSRNRSAQALLEYVTMAILVMAAVIYGGPFLVNSIGGYFKIADNNVSDAVNEKLQPAGYETCACNPPTPDPRGNPNWPGDPPGPPGACGVGCGDLEKKWTRPCFGSCPNTEGKKWKCLSDSSCCKAAVAGACGTTTNSTVVQGTTNTAKASGMGVLWQCVAEAFVGTAFAGQNNNCGMGCLTGLTCCNNSCVNTNTNANNCGGCGVACGQNQTCASGSCTGGEGSGCGLGCSAPLTCCNNSCVNMSTDESNCGACGTVCAQGETCDRGACSGGGSLGCGECSPGTICCDNSCVNTSTDEGHCGGCGVACDPGDICKSGSCSSGGGTGGPPIPIIYNPCVKQDPIALGYVNFFPSGAVGYCQDDSGGLHGCLVGQKAYAAECGQNLFVYGCVPDNTCS